MTRAFVLSGGASLGAIQVGMLQALFERRLTPDLIIGSQAGAINGAFLATRGPSVQTTQALGDLWHELRRGVFPSSPLAGLIGLMGRGDRLVSQGPLRKVVGRHLQVDRLEDMHVPLHVVVTDVLSGEELRLSAGPALDAVMASAAIPGVFSPIEFQGRALMDGGVSDNTPVSHAVELGADEIYVLADRSRVRVARAAARRAGDAAARHEPACPAASAVRYRCYAKRARLIVLPPPCPQGVEPTDFSHADELIDGALITSRAFLKSIDPPDHRRADVTAAKLLGPHSHAAPA